MIENQTKIPKHMIGFFTDMLKYANAEFLGVQLNLISPEKAGLFFRHPITKKTLSVVFNPDGFDCQQLAVLVEKRIMAETSRHDDRTVSVSVATLVALAEKLSDLSKELEALYKEKE